MYHKLINIFNAARLHVALIYGLIAITFVWTQGISTPELVAVLSFTSLLSATYLFNRIMDVDSDKISQPGEELDGGVVAFVVALLTLTPIAFLTIFSLPVLPYVVFIAIGMSYSLPIFFGKSFKEILVLKNLYAAGAWYVSFVLLQSVYAGTTPLLVSFISSLHVFVLIFAYEVIWDIRDIDADRAFGVKTIPNTFGIIITRSLLLSLFVWVLWKLDFDITHPVSVALIVLTPIALFATHKTPRFVFHMAIYLMLAAVVVFIL